MRDLLPPFELLSKEQDEAIRSATEKSLLVTGPPGSGKTVIALFRAAELRRRKMSVDIIVFGNVLFSYLKKSLNGLKVPIDVKADTFHKWLRAYVRRRFNCNAPTTVDQFTYDWDVLGRWHRESGFKPEFAQLIVDEAQDLPVDFMRLAPYISNAVTVFADQNQKIYQSASTLADIRSALRRFQPRELKLDKNYRNSKSIASLAARFCTEGIETGIANVPVDRDVGDLPELCRYKNEASQVERIVTYAKVHPDQQVGVFLYRKAEVRDWYGRISAAFKGNVQFYSWQKGEKNEPPDFSKPGIFVVTYYSAKGLEFDSVFLPQMHKLPSAGDDTQRMLLYVVLSRARESLVMMYTGDAAPPIVERALAEAAVDEVELVKRFDEAAVGRAARQKAVAARQTPGAGELRMSTFLDAVDAALDERLFEQVWTVIRVKYKETDVVSKEAVKMLIQRSLRAGLARKVTEILDRL